jgi:hypothetical protein
MYFVIRNSEDGISITKIDDIDNFLVDAAESNTDFLCEFPEDPWNKKRNNINRESNFNLGNTNEEIIIKGEIVVPVKKEKVTVYELE